LVDYEPRVAGALLQQGDAYRTGTFQGPKHPAVPITIQLHLNPPLFTPLNSLFHRVYGLRYISQYVRPLNALTVLLFVAVINRYPKGPFV
jgi:hypothetical protein